MLQTHPIIKQVQPIEGRDGRQTRNCQTQSSGLISYCRGVALDVLKKEKMILLQVAPVYVKPDTAAIHERIGFDPKPKLQ